MIVNYEKLEKIKRSEWLSVEPFPHVVIDGLFEEEYLLKVLEEFPGIEDVSWWKYDNVFEFLFRMKGENQIIRT